MSRTVVHVTAVHGLDFELESVTPTEHGEFVVSGRRVDAIDTEMLQVPAGTPVSFLYNPLSTSIVLATARVVEVDTDAPDAPDAPVTEVARLRQLVFDMGAFEGTLTDEQSALVDEVWIERGVCPKCSETLPAHHRGCQERDT